MNYAFPRFPMFAILLKRRLLMSVYTELKINSFVRCAFAQTLATTDYAYELQNFGYGVYGHAPVNGGILEIGFVEENPLILTSKDGQEFLVEENAIFIIPPESYFSVRASTPKLHRHTTVEFLLRYRSMKKVSHYSPPDGRYVTFPLVIPPTTGNSEVFQAIRNIVCAKTTQSERSFFEECADFMGLIHKINTLLLSTKNPQTISPGNRRYCERAKSYISENIDKRLSVAEVAKAAGVSKNYLTNVFSSSEGIPLVEYINRRKLSYMIELIRRYDYTLAQAGEHVGFTDANYVSRIFKRYYGLTLTEYKRNKMNQRSVKNEDISKEE